MRVEVSLSGDVRIRHRWAVLASVMAASGLCLAAAPAGSTELAPVPRGGARLQAVAAISGGGALPLPCATPLLQSALIGGATPTPAARRALLTLTSDVTLPGERRASAPDGTSVRYTVDRGVLDRVEGTDDDGNGRPDVVDEAIDALTRVQRLLTSHLELPSPGSSELVLARLGSGVEGFETTSRDGRTQMWIDPSPRGGLPAVRRAVEHQYAHAVAAAAGLDPAWGEAFASWATLTLEGNDDDAALGAIAHRLAAGAEGLPTDDLRRAAGNAAWFAFLDEAYGGTAVKLAVEELGSGSAPDPALDRALRRAGADTLDAAFRDYQLWSLLVGPRDDKRHFSFASRMPAPTFAAVADALPALSVQSDPAVAPLGGAAILLRPGERTGGLSVRFEGDLTARWAADLLLVRPDGAMQRVPFVLDQDDAGDLTVPLQDVREVVLLVRNLDPTGRASRSYTWAAHYAPGFPVEMVGRQAPAAAASGGRIVSWETFRETGVIGFNVLRVPAEGGAPSRVNPVWIPAVGDSNNGAEYSFLDPGAEAGAAYRYRIEAITAEGLQSRSDWFASPPVR
jgi:hypothetical protein